MTELLLTIICGILLIIGFVGIFVPAIPDIPLAWASLVLYAWGTDFEEATITTIIVFTIITLIISVLDILGQFIGAQKLKSSKAGLIGILGGITIGLFFAPFGPIIGSILGAFVGEYLYKRDLEQALKSAIGSLIGFLCGSVIKAIFIIVIAFYFIVILI